MMMPNKNPLFPACLAADGKQGADAKAQGPCGSQDSAEVMRAHYQTRMAVEAACEHLDALGLAAIHLADFAPPIKEADGGDA